jgi:hypothetical protein
LVFYAKIIIKIENGKATHVEMNSTQKWEKTYHMIIQIKLYFEDGEQHARF